jgi:GT2 family glycosyltransferase
VNGIQVGTVDNSSAGSMPFEFDFPVADCRADTWAVEFRTRYLYRPSERGTGGDRRDLGFALVLMGSLEPSNGNHFASRKAGLEGLIKFIRKIDSYGRRLNRLPFLSRPAPDLIGEPGISIIIPERDNLEELTSCLASMRQASERWVEPLETIVMANGSDPTLYWGLRGEYPGVRWLFHRRPMGFAMAVQAGLRAARYSWVYLLNNDIVLESGALRELANFRGHRTFSIASQILLKDTTRYRDETNWGALVIESGLATLHDWIPRSEATVDTFYAGGGASLFHKKLLEQLIDPPVYDPFYWEDAEWGWRARKLGYASLFCPASVAHHTQHATIRRHYPACEVEAIMRRNRLLFQLRNFTSVGSLDRVIEEIAGAPEALGSFFQEPRIRWRIARGRLWNHLAPVPDEELIEQWQRSSAPAPAAWSSVTS